MQILPQLQNVTVFVSCVATNTIIDIVDVLLDVMSYPWWAWSSILVLNVIYAQNYEGTVFLEYILTSSVFCAYIYSFVLHSSNGSIWDANSCRFATFVVIEHEGYSPLVNLLVNLPLTWWHLCHISLCLLFTLLGN